MTSNRSGSGSAGELPDSIHRLEGRELDRLVLDNGRFRAVVLPALGGKLASLVNLASGREFLRQPTDRPWRRALPGLPFDQSDASGFDECFPTVAACRYSGGAFDGIELPDHGELWRIPWEAEVREGELRLRASASCLPCRLEKRLRLTNRGVEIGYGLTSLAGRPFSYLWSAHPLLEVEAGAEIVLPPEVTELTVEGTHGMMLGEKGTRCAWPRARDAGGSAVDLHHLTGPERRNAAKLFSPRLSQGYCGLYFPRTDESIAFRFDPRVTPYVGLWICQGGWPLDRAGHFTVALEPCSGRPDSLAEAIARQECPVLRPGETHRWDLQIELHQGNGKLLIAGDAP